MKKWKMIEEYACSVEGIADYCLDMWRYWDNLPTHNEVDRVEKARSLQIFATIYKHATGQKPEHEVSTSECTHCHEHTDYLEPWGKHRLCGECADAWRQERGQMDQDRYEYLRD